MVKNIKLFFIVMMATVIFASKACEDTPTIPVQDAPEIMIVEHDDSTDLPILALHLLHECFENNDVQSCQASLGLMTIMAMNRQQISDDKLVGKKRKIKLQQETINKYGKIIDTMYAKKKKEEQSVDY